MIVPTTMTNFVPNSFAGDILRIGGSVDHITSYKNFSVHDLNIENRRRKKFGDSFIGRLRYGCDLFEQELRFWRKGYRTVREGNH